MSLFHLIAPSGYCIKQHAALRGIQRLTDAGHQVNNVEVIARRCERFAGTETERLEDLNSCQTSPQHHRAVCTRRLRYQSFTGNIDWQALVFANNMTRYSFADMRFYRHSVRSSAQACHHL
ncbi:MAG: LD-carboxypeptidase [Escherichia sp.]